MAEKFKVAAISSLFTLFAASIPGFVVFGSTINQHQANTAQIAKNTESISELKEIAAAQRELNRLLQRYFEEKTK